MTKTKIPEPPEAVKNGDKGHKEIWDAIWGVRVLVAQMQTEVRLLGALVLILAATVVGHTVLT